MKACRIQTATTATKRQRAAFLLLTWLCLPVANGNAAPLTINDFGSLALRCGPNVAPVTLASVAKTESGLDPFLIHDNDTKTAYEADNADAAAEFATRLIGTGHSVDLGLMQINSKNLPRLGVQVKDAFDPCVSIGAAALILSDAYVGGETHDAQQRALRVSLSRYNTGKPDRGFENGYVGRVEASARKVVPALDVAGVEPRAEPLAPLHTNNAAPVDPNAPPAWDVWASYDYSAASPEGRKGKMTRTSDAALFVGSANTATVFTSASKD